MGGKASRRKGFDAEREVVNLAKAYDMDARRTPCSISPDVVINGTTYSVKRRKNGHKEDYDELETHDRVLFRADGKYWLQIKRWGPGQ